MRPITLVGVIVLAVLVSLGAFVIHGYSGDQPKLIQKTTTTTPLAETSTETLYAVRASHAQGFVFDNVDVNGGGLIDAQESQGFTVVNSEGTDSSAPLIRTRNSKNWNIANIEVPEGNTAIDADENSDGYNVSNVKSVEK